MATIRTYSGNFSTFNSTTGVQTTADSLPTATANLTGAVESHTTATVTNIGTGLYKWTCALDGAYWADKNELSIVVTAVVNSITEVGEVAHRTVSVYDADDNFARLGAPAGNSVSADIAANLALMISGVSTGTISSSAISAIKTGISGVSVSADQIAGTAQTPGNDLSALIANINGAVNNLVSWTGTNGASLLSIPNMAKETGGNAATAATQATNAAATAASIFTATGAGALGASLLHIGDTRMANLDQSVSDAATKAGTAATDAAAVQAALAGMTGSDNLILVSGDSGLAAQSTVNDILSEADTAAAQATTAATILTEMTESV